MVSRGSLLFSTVSLLGVASAPSSGGSHHSGSQHICLGSRNKILVPSTCNGFALDSQDMLRGASIKGPTGPGPTRPRATRPGSRPGPGPDPGPTGHGSGPGPKNIYIYIYV